MQEGGKVVQDESGSNCGETRLWNKHFWKRSERCSRRKLEKNKSCVHGERLIHCGVERHKENLHES